MRSRIVTLLAAGAAAAASLALSATPASAATTVVSTLDASSSFQLDDVRSGGSAIIGTTYGAPAGFGKGAVELTTPDGASKVQVKTTQQAGQPLKTLATSFSYQTFRSPTSTATPVQVPALNVEADLNGLATSGGFTTFVFEPVYNVASPADITAGIWQKWNAAAGKWWTTRAAAPFTRLGGNEQRAWSEVVAANPDAVILSVAVNQGTGNGGLIAAADALTVGALTVDFEPFVPTKEDCKNRGWATKFPAGKFKNQGDCVSSFAGG